MHHFLALLISCALALLSPAVSRAAGTLSPEDEAMIKKLPLKTKVGQLLMIGFVGDNSDHALTTTIEKLRPGAVIIFKRNIKSARQVSDLTLSAQKSALKVSGLPLLLATDQEGGDVARIQTASPLPSALALGRTKDMALIARAGKATGLLMKTLGLNMNLAPVVDLGDPQKHLFIGTRAYGHEPELVADAGESFADGLGSAGVLATAKHFPGHGSVSEDSHLETPTVKSTYEQLKDRDLLPFRRLAKNAKWPVALMLAHISFPAIDPTGMPATFSKPIVTGLLRKQFGFDGLVVTDDIEMGGAQIIKDVRERAVHAIDAGADLIMIGWNKKTQSDVVDGIIKAVESGRLSEARLDESLRRILIAKRAFATKPLAAPTDDGIRQAVRNPEFKSIASVVLENRFSRPLDPHEEKFRERADSRPVFVFSPNVRFSQTLAKSIGGHPVRVFALGADQRFQIDRVMNANPTAVGVVYVSGEKTVERANQISPDVAARLLLVTSIPVGSFSSPSDFAAIADIYYRHPDLGQFIAKRYFNDPHVRQPASGTRSASTMRKTPARLKKL